MERSFILVCAVALCVVSSSAFTTTTVNAMISHALRPTPSFYIRKTVHPAHIFLESPSLYIAEESWRQYVPLAVSAGVIVDILLGSPLANTVLKPLRGAQEAAENDMQKPTEINKSKERIDSDAIAQAALDKAASTLELRKFLDERKTDWDRMEDMKRKLDTEMQDLDEDLLAREQALSERRERDGNSST